MGFLDSIFGGGDQKVTQSNKPGPWLPGMEDLWGQYIDTIQGTPARTGGGQTAGTAPSGGAGTSGELPPDEELQFLQAIKDGIVPAFREVERGSHPLFKGDYIYNPAWGVKDGSPGYPGTTLDPARQEEIANQLQYGASLDDLMARREAALQGVYGPGSGGESTPGEPSIFDKIREQTDWLRDQQGEYTQAIGDTSQQVQSAIRGAAANPMQFSFNGQSLGGIIPQGGIKAANLMRNEQMLAPTSRWEGAQQFPLYQGDMRAFDLLRDINETQQQWRYGVPTTTRTTSGSPSAGQMIGGTLSGLSTLQDLGGLGGIFDLFGL